jgi:cytochrome P450
MRGITFDYTSESVAGPRFWDAIRHLRRRGALVWVESNGGHWVTTSHEMALLVLQDWRTFSSAEGITHPRPSPDVLPYFMPQEFDPPRQRPYRQQINPYLTPTMVALYEPRIRGIADELIDAFVDRSSFDLCQEFGRKFPGTVFFRLVAGSSDEEFKAVEPQARIVAFTRDQDERARAAAEVRAWASRVFQSRASRPAETDIVDAVFHLRDTGASFSDDELLTGLGLLAMGGIGTSSSAIASIVRLLCEHPHVQRRARQNLGIVPAIVEETLRMEPPLSMVFRTVTRGARVAGRYLKQGEKVCVLFGAANRDPAVFDRPDEFDIDRRQARHLTFSGGPHRCIGSNLARLQIRIAIEQLLLRLGPFRLASGAVIEYAPPNLARSLWSLPIEIEMARPRA